MHPRMVVYAWIRAPGRQGQKNPYKFDDSLVYVVTGIHIKKKKKKGKIETDKTHKYYVTF